MQKKYNCSLLESALRKDLSNLIKKIPKEFKNYMKIIKNAIKNIDNFKNAVEFLNEILIEFNIFKDYTEAFETQRIENIQAFCDMLLQFETIHSEYQGTELIYEFLLDLSLFQEKNNYVEKKKKEESLIVSTIHRAKGLEAKVVFIIGIANGILPSNSKKHQIDSLEEERRLLFVAMTRAKDYLYISFSKGFSYLIDDIFCESIFLKELNVSNYERIEIPILTEKLYNNEQWHENINVNNSIKHAIFGIGIIIEKTKTYLLVNFNGKIKKIYYISPLWKMIKI